MNESSTTEDQARAEVFGPFDDLGFAKCRTVRRHDVCACRGHHVRVRTEWDGFVLGPIETAALEKFRRAAGAPGSHGAIVRPKIIKAVCAKCGSELEIPAVSVEITPAGPGAGAEPRPWTRVYELPADPGPDDVQAPAGDGLIPVEELA